MLVLVSDTQVMDEYEMNMFRKQLKAWEAERQRQQVEFTITEHDLDADKRVPSVVEIMVRTLNDFSLLFNLSSDLSLFCHQSFLSFHC